MKKNIAYTLFLSVFFVLQSSSLLGRRSVHRPKNPHLPQIVTHWEGKSQTYKLADIHLGEYPFFKIYNERYLKNHSLPEKHILFRHSRKNYVDGKILREQIDHLMKEVHQKKKTYTHFDILQTKDFNRKKACGLIVLKFKNYPFVVKLFIETPESFVSPYSKGFEPIFFFFMGDGINRHLSGLTRLKNRELLKRKLAKSKQWSSKVDLPRKWFYVPKQSKKIVVNGTNIGKKKHQKIKIPGTYCVIADAIDIERNFSIGNKQDRQTALSICNDLDFHVDPHIKNFMTERGTGKIMIVDTEHFPSMVGIKQRPQFNSYFGWYRQLINKCAQDMFMCSKDYYNDRVICPEYELRIN